MNLLDLPRNILLRVFTSMPIVYFADATRTCKKINKLFHYYMSNPNLSLTVQSSRLMHLKAIIMIRSKIISKIEDKLRTQHIKKRRINKLKRKRSKSKNILENTIEVIILKGLKDAYYFEYFVYDTNFPMSIRNMDQYELSCRLINNKSPKIAKFAGFHNLPYEYTNLTAYKSGRMKAGEKIPFDENLLRYAVKYDHNVWFHDDDVYAFAVYYNKIDIMSKYSMHYNLTFDPFRVICSNDGDARDCMIKYLIKNNYYEHVEFLQNVNLINLGVKYELMEMNFQHNRNISIDEFYIVLGQALILQKSGFIN